ncbi:hypothetical protein GH714_041329 [Hevea brasiliensis]|uniref:Uncharacterized protein n=1 Tax=Hevea brasiliensis TaxID=3981 RepID=A0A6A6MVU6_HEVBR|nr:hypothetical protein GH714_041329 [Hevea brasiliensis]
MEVPFPHLLESLVGKNFDDNLFDAEREGDTLFALFCLSWFEVESAPAIVFVKDPGVNPVVFHELPQLRSVTSMEIGCDARGYCRAGVDTMSWYCVILAGRQGPELKKMRETMRRVQQLLSNDGELSDVDEDQSLLLASALQNKRLTFAWLDGEAQQNEILSTSELALLPTWVTRNLLIVCLHKSTPAQICGGVISSTETSYDTCRPRRDLTDVPRLFIVHYKRNATQDNVNVRKNEFEHEDADPASQLVARYCSSDEIPQIIQWISGTIRDGEARDLPFFKAKTPDVVPEDSDPIWSKGAQSIRSKSVGIKHMILKNIGKTYDHMGDPRIGPILLLGALMSFGTIWLMRNQPTHQSQSSQSNVKVSEPSVHVHFLHGGAVLLSICSRYKQDFGVS